MKNKKPFISIVIPTRQRHETLKYTIKTILNQNFNNYQIIIGDNNSTKETKDVVKEFNSNKINYYRSNVDLSLADSYEFSVSKATGEYIMVMADNDGIIEGGLEFIVDILNINNNPLVINFIKNNYNWPCLKDGENNILYLHKNNPSIESIDGFDLIQKILDNNGMFYKLPMIYNSIVHHSLIKKMKKKTGKIFNSVTPDTYSGFCIAMLSKNFLKLNYPITIAGNSSKSLGVNYLNTNDGIIKKENESRKESKIQLHSLCPLVSSHTTHLIDSFLRATETLEVNKFLFDRKKVLLDIINDLYAFNESELDTNINTILNSCDDDIKLQTFIKNYINRNKPKIKQSYKENTIPLGFIQNRLRLDGKTFNLSTIYDVSKFMTNFYNYSINFVNYPNLSKDYSNIEQNSTIAIWGNGEYGKHFLKIIKEQRKDLKILCLIDSFKENNNSFPKVLTPNKLPQNIDYIIMASSYIKDISQLIKKYSLDKTSIILTYYKEEN